MNEQLLLLRAQLHMIWLYRWVVMLVAGLVCLGGWFVVLSLPNTYEVSAKVYIDTRSMLRPLLRGLTVDTRMLQNTALLMRRTLLTRPNLEAIARNTDMDLDAKTPQQLEAIVTGLGKDIKLTGSNRENIYTVTYSNPNPRLAKKVVEEVLNTFMEKTLGETRKDSVVTEKFLDEQIAQYEQKLIDSEDRLKEFKRKNVGLMPGSDKSFYSELKHSQDQLSQAQLELREVQNRAAEIRRQLQGEEPVFGIVQSRISAMSSPELAKLDQRLSGMQEQLDGLLLKYTDKHPDIIALKSTMAKLQKQRDAEAARIAEEAALAPSGPEPLNQNPYYQELKISLSTATAQVAALKTRVAEYNRRVKELKQLVDTVPEVEAELKRLDRDYGLNKRQYDELVKRREAAQLSKSAEKTEDIKLNVIDPPRVPLVPTGPKRPQLLSMVFVGGLGLGIALAWLLAQLKPRIFNGEELKNFTGLPVIGTVSLAQSRWQTSERRMEAALYGLVFLLLGGAYATLLSLQLMNVDLHGYLIRIVEKII